MALGLFCLSLAVYSQEAEDLIYQACQEIVESHPDMKPQIKLIAKGLREISERQLAKQTELQTTIDGQATKISNLETTLKDSQDSQTALTISHLAVENDLKNYAASLRTEATIAETIGVISLIFNGIQLINSAVKK